MELLLGLDGGGSGCRAVAADRAGRVLGRGEAGPANIMSDPEGARASIMAAAGRALGGRDPARAAACLGLAGANMSGAREWLAPLLPFGRSRVVHDAVTSVAGALGPADGIVAALGTGSIFARQFGGEVVTLGGWGMVLSDEASGAWLGKRFLAQALRAGEGLAPQGPLADALVAEMGGPAGVVGFARTATGAEFAALVPRIAAAVDDPAAEAVLAEGTGHVIAAVEHLRGGRALPVVFLGGLGPLYAARIAGRWEVRAPLGTALDGALRLAAALAGP
ncbi:ATPase [Paracoccus sp. S-4012]|uniref:BadF/BadG/BcrA/BcrD ATPase family protein n=1 Tax=Paracoccus sp. S-4012 TaxID=2665648 RepID=UPI0012AF579B|nr:BadF/BadG/BcrA/BcrD ATPase family protein [Paracoccus sp. S-4012]MRX49325.1 ATPase [Paracoccus sp. S-4012]